MLDELEMKVVMMLAAQPDCKLPFTTLWAMCKRENMQTMTTAKVMQHLYHQGYINTTEGDGRTRDYYLTQEGYFAYMQTLNEASPVRAYLLFEQRETIRRAGIEAWQEQFKSKKKQDEAFLKSLGIRVDDDLFIGPRQES